MKYSLRIASLNDYAEIRSLYERVASIEGGLARKKSEITEEYITNFIQRSTGSGVIVVAIDSSNNAIIGEIHCYNSNVAVFNHVLGELTIAVDPQYQGKGIGRLLFTKLLDIIKQ